MKKNSRVTKLLIWLWSLVGFGIACVIAVFIYAYPSPEDIPSFAELEFPKTNLATHVYADDGTTILSTFHVENRSYVTYKELPEHLVQAAIATEDIRFYEHSGIDYESLARVAFKTILSGDASQGGGSTISQQLAKTLFPRENDNILKVKMKEWVTAVKIEHSYTKDEIITMYFNHVFFGSNAYGIKAAAMTYFGKEPADLTIEESATLVGIVNKPSRYNPKSNMQQSLKRRNFVLSQMCKAGFISEHDRDSLQKLEINLSSYQVQDHTAGTALYFRAMLRKIMSRDKPVRELYSNHDDYAADSLLWETDQLYGWLNKNFKADGSKYNLDRDGLKIYTTINPKMQQYAEEALAQHIGGDMQNRFNREIKGRKNAPFFTDVTTADAEKSMQRSRRESDRYRNLKAAGCSESEIRESFATVQKLKVFSWEKHCQVDTLMSPDDSIRYYKSLMRASFVAMTPGNGHVKAYVGGPDFMSFQYDNVRQGKRQVGSTIKPFLYTLAMQEGMTPCDKVANVPQTFIIEEDKIWTPRSTDRDEYIGNMVTLKWGLAKSSNNISAYLMKQYGPEAMVEMMRKMGVTAFLDPVPPLCVGSADISLYEMVGAYNTFPSQGFYVRPMFVTKIEDSMGNVISTFSEHKREAISAETAFLMANLMQGVVNSGTGYALRSRFALDGEIAGKTGTTNNNADGWFIGYTPQLTAGVWAGFEDKLVHFRGTGNGGGAGASLPIWGLFMQKVRKDPSLSEYYSQQVFTPPLGLEGGINLNCDAPETTVPTYNLSPDYDVYIDNSDEEMEIYGFN